MTMTLLGRGLMVVNDDVNNDYNNDYDGEWRVTRWVESTGLDWTKRDDSKLSVLSKKEGVLFFSFIHFACWFSFPTFSSFLFSLWFLFAIGYVTRLIVDGDMVKGDAWNKSPSEEYELKWIGADQDGKSFSFRKHPFQQTLWLRQWLNFTLTSHTTDFSFAIE